MSESRTLPKLWDTLLSKLFSCKIITNERKI